VIQLDDLRLRRVGIDLTLPSSGLAEIESTCAAVQAKLGWYDPRWIDKVEAYRNTLTQSCSPASEGSPKRQGQTIRTQVTL
jgi:hypothetical protein